MYYQKLVLTLSALLGTLLSINCLADSLPCTTEIIKTANGPVCGIEVAVPNMEQTADVFLGIPFAESTAGNNRWKPPKSKKHWRKTLQATQFGVICPQPLLFPIPQPEQGEDCLSLNVWTPTNRQNNANLPVMVFIHGGAFLVGGGSLPLYDSSYLATKENVVVVTFNYRVGALGFLNHRDLRGNYGFLDQQQALKWVQNNIQYFGGDPDQVTIFGQSAGAMSVGLHLASAPSSQKLFRAGIVQSNAYSLPYQTRKEAGEIGKLFASLLNCRNSACLRKQSVEDILLAQSQVVSYFPIAWQGVGSILTWAPTIDGRVLKNQPLEAKFIRKPNILGTTLDEGIVFASFMSPDLAIPAIGYAALMDLMFGDKAPQVLAQYPPSEIPLITGLTLAQVLTDYGYTCSNNYVAEQSATGGHAYFFTQYSSFNPLFSLLTGIPACAGKVCHGFELPYVFHLDYLNFTPAEEQLSQEVVHYWANFATHLDPNDEGNVTWPSFKPDNNYLILDTSLNTQADPFVDVCDFWDGIGYDRSAHLWPNLVEAMKENIKAAGIETD
jgi:carboxylesterase type B